MVGWTHPYGSGASFMKEQAIPKDLIIVDLDNIHPAVFYQDKEIPMDWIQTNFVRKNSFIAGYASALHGIMSFGAIPNGDTKVAILGSGNVSQGAFQAASRFNTDIRMFYRKTISEFKNQLDEFDIIINGIEVDKPNLHILSLKDQKRLKKGCLIIDAAANAGKAIEGCKHTTYSEPIYVIDGVYYYAVNNSPSIFYREASRHISDAFSKNVYCKDVGIYLDMIKDFDNESEMTS